MDAAHGLLDGLCPRLDVYKRQLEEGENTIEISFLPAGMKLGAAAALLGAVLLWLLLLGARRGWLYQPWLQRGSLWVLGAAGVAAFAMLYLFPMAVYLLV